MPRIRKKTSNRKSTFDRSKLKHKVAEGRKKNKKLAKKNPQWKSKHAKDPGIPNNFPFKDQILAEVAAERRRDEEEKQQRKELRKAEKAAAREEVAEKGHEEDGEEDAEEDGAGFDGVSSVRTSAVNISSLSLSAKGKERTTVVEEEEEDEVPILINSEYVDMQTVLDKADVVLQVLDARDPLSYQSTHLQKHLSSKGKGKLIMVLNKIDTCPRETVQSWATTLRRSHPTYLFRSASAFLPKLEVTGTASASKTDAPAPSTSDAVGLDSLLKELASEASKKSDGPLHVALIGVANTGKSSLLNSFLRKLISPIYKLSSTPSGPSTTERPLEVTLEHDGKKINLIDTPALSWIPPADIDGGEASILRGKDVLLRNKGRIDRVKEPIVPVTDIVARANAEDLMLFYNLPAFTSGNATAFLSALGRGHGLVKRKGEANLVDAARIVLRDWSTGRLPRFAVPSPAADANAKIVEGKYEDDEEILKAAPLRKEMRKGRGIVRLVSGSVETREAVLDSPWEEEEEESDEDEDKEEGGAIGSDDEEIGSDEIDEDAEPSEDEDEDEEEAEEDTPPPPPTKNKRKRQEKSAPTPSPASKKVAFASHPVGSKQARAAPAPSVPSKPVKPKTNAGPKAKKQRK